jgi:hypothetical protein
MIFETHVSINVFDKFKWKDRARINPCTYSKKNLLCQRVPSLCGFILTSLVDIETNDILELDQWNHVDALDVEEIMHQIWLDMIKFNRLKDKAKLKVNFNFNAQSKKLKGID